MNTSWGQSKHYNIGPKKYPPPPRGKRRTRNTSKQHWAFSKTSRKRDPKKEEDRNKRHSISTPYLSGVLEKFRRILQKHDIPVQLKPSNSLRQRLVHPKDKSPRHKQCNVVYALQCQKECNQLYIGETKQPLNKYMAQQRRATSSGQDSA